MGKRKINNGFYISIREYQEVGLENLNIYRHDNSTGKWFLFKTGEEVSENDLPVPGFQMWPMRPVAR